MFEDMGIHALVAFPSLDGAQGRWLPNTKPRASRSTIAPHQA